MIIYGLKKVQCYQSRSAQSKCSTYEQLVWRLTLLCSNPMTVPSFFKCSESMVHSRNENVVYCLNHCQGPINPALQGNKIADKKADNTSEYVPPQPLDGLIMDRVPCCHASSFSSTMLKHVLSYQAVFFSLI